MNEWMDGWMDDGGIVKILMYYLRLFQRVVYQELITLTSFWRYNIFIGDILTTNAVSVGGPE